MKVFDYNGAPQTLLKPDVVAMLTGIHAHKGKQALFMEAHADGLTALMEIAKVQSTGASNRIEGIHTTDKRLVELVRDRSMPRNRTEQEIAGYRDVLATIHESYDYIHPRPSVILQLHRQLYAFAQSAIGGVYKNADNYIAETSAEGEKSIRFQPVPAYLTALAMDNLCRAFNESLQKNEHDPLLLISMFVLDFLCIHPFNDGNGRMSRLLTLLLLYRAGYLVGKYISLEKLIESSKDSYYEALQDSSIHWHENRSDYLPFVRYTLGILLKACNEFEDRMAHLHARGMSKPDRVKAAIDRKIGTISKKEIMEACPDISKITVERTLAAMVKAGVLVKIGAGPAMRYGRVDNHESGGFPY
jgi:Fic family protein